MILTVIGARPQFVKAAAVSRALKTLDIKEIIIHTGQHYDESMSKVFWTEMDIPEPYINLGIGSGTQAEQTARIMIALEKVMIDLKPAAVMVYGDTNSTLAAALTAAKLNINLIHIESGLRSFNRKMPEEINRITTDHLSDILFCSSADAVNQLSREGVSENVFLVGDVMYDSFTFYWNKALARQKLNEILPFEMQEFVLATIHRPSNTNVPEKIKTILASFETFSSKVLWPVHPRMQAEMHTYNIPANVFLCNPVSYFEMLELLHACTKVCTDSGGLQKEAYWAKKPCITLRTETEWVETLHHNWNIITGTDKMLINQAFNLEIDFDTWKPLYGDGTAAISIAKHLKSVDL